MKVFELSPSEVADTAKKRGLVLSPEKRWGLRPYQPNAEGIMRFRLHVWKDADWEPTNVSFLLRKDGN